MNIQQRDTAKNCDEVDNSEDDNCNKCSLFHVEYLKWTHLSPGRQ